MSAISNARWILFSQASRTIILLISLVVLSRLLKPSEYGLMAMCTVVVNLVNLLRDMGTAAAVIQKEDLTEKTTSTVFWLNIALGLTLALLLVILSPWIADAFHTPALTPILWVVALSFPISSTFAVHQALLERANRFGLVARIEILSTFGGLVVALVLAFNGAGVYSLAFQTVAAIAISGIQLWIASPWRPKMIWCQTEFRSLWGYSGNFTIFILFNYVSRNADAMIIGRILGAVQLGIYSQAYKVMMFPLQTMSFVAGRAMFPIMSRQQNEPEAMAKLYLRALSMITLITAPLLSGLWVLRDPFVYIALGPQWDSVGRILAWLAPVGFIQSLYSTVGTVFMSLGRTNLLVRLGVLNTALQISSFMIGARWGIEGIAVGYLISNLINIFPAMYLTLKQMNASLIDLWVAIWRPILAAAGMVVCLIPLVRYLASQHVTMLVALLVPVTVGVLLYAGLIFLISPGIISDLRQVSNTK